MHSSRRRLIPFQLAPLALVLLAAFTGGCGKKKGDTYGDKMVGALREAKAMDARGDMQSISLAVTSWIANDGSLADAPDFDALIAHIEPTWVRVAPRIDPWGKPYEWSTDGTSWKLQTPGRDGKRGTDDDMVMSDGQITQIPKSFTPVGAN